MSDCLAPLRDEENPLETQGMMKKRTPAPPTCNWTLRPRRGHASTNTHTHTVTTLTLPFPPPNKALIDEVKLRRVKAERTETRLQTAIPRDSFNVAANRSLPVKYEAFQQKATKAHAV